MTNSLIGQEIDKYQIKSRLGDGGMGSVYLAHDNTLARDVAIKIMHPHFARQDTFRQRFQLEAQAMAKLSHSGIVQVYDFGERDGWLYIAMEYIRGGNLRQMLDALQAHDQWITLAEALETVRQLALGLEYAHNNNILHRDIKPANIMVKSVPSGILDYQPVITDLGLAKLEGGKRITSTGTAMGTLAYMSPEQARGINLDRRSDIYSLGILLYELVCGKLPFVAENWSKALRQHTEEPPPLLELSRPDIPSDVAAIVLKALQKDPSGRFTSAAAIAVAIERLSPDTLLATVPPNAVAGATSIKTVLQQSLVSPRFQSLFDDFPSLVAAETAIQLLNADGSVETVALNQTSYALGRSSNNDLVINDNKASREHARIDTNGQTFRVTDLGSANGTFLGNSQLLANVPQEWNPEQALRIGQHYLRLVPAQAQSALVTKIQPIGTPSDSTTPPDMRLFIPQDRAIVQPGQTVALPIVLVNQSVQVSRFDLSVEGVPSDWIVPTPTINLMPSGTSETAITFQPPQTTDSRAEEYEAVVRAVNRDNPTQTISAGFTLAIESFGKIQSQLRPQEGKSGKPMRVELTNQSNQQQTVQLSWSDSGELLEFEPAQGAEIQLEPGETQTVDFVPTLRKRPWVGGNKNHSIAVQVVTPESNGGQNLTGTVSSRGLVPTWVPPLLLGLMGVIAAGLFFGLDRLFPTSPEVVTGPTPGIVTSVDTDTDSVAQVPLETTLKPDQQATEAAQQTADAAVAADAQQTADAQATTKADELNATATAEGDAQAAAAALTTANAEATVAAAQEIANAQATLAAEQTAEAEQTATVVQAAAEAQWLTATVVQMTAETGGTAAALEAISAAATQTSLALTAEAGQTATAIQMTVEAETAEANQTSTALAATLTAEAIPTPLPLLPDLRISKVSLDPSTPTQDGPVSVQVEVYNQGTGSAGAFTVQWWAGENYPGPACTWPVEKLVAQEKKSFTCRYDGYPSWYGNITTMAVADSSGEVAESNMANNANKMTISVSPPSTISIEFDSYPDGAPTTSDRILNGDEFLSKGIRLAGAPESSYCTEATMAAIRGPGTYNGVTFNFLTSASPGQVNRCNGIPVEIMFTDPVRQVTLTFAGASVTYTMKAYNVGGGLLGTVQEDAVLAAGTFEIDFSSTSANIKRITFGSEQAITAIKQIAYKR